MNFSNQLASEIFYRIGEIIERIAKYFGYPENPGMPDIPRFSNLEQERFEQLPVHNVKFPPEPVPHNIFEIIFGVIPKTDVIDKFFYESPTEGYYNFYIPDYKNLYFLPDSVSELIQMGFNIYSDLSSLEAIRESIFILLILYVNLLNLRICMYWFLTINPYTYPWIILIYLVDWTEDLLQGFVPTITGVNLTAGLWFTIIGKMADSLNHLVFTMPFLPSEGTRLESIFGDQLQQVVAFRYLPILWYEHGIPNDLREYWYQERQDILVFMYRSYRHLNMKLLPDSIVGNESAIIKKIAEQFPEEPIPNDGGQFSSLGEIPETSVTLSYSNIFNITELQSRIENILTSISSNEYLSVKINSYIKFLPDSLLSFQKDKITIEVTEITEPVSTQILSNIKLVQIDEFTSYITKVNDSFHDFILLHIDKSI